MSGHSKWATIKHKKGAADIKRGKLFGKLIRQVEVAAREGGGDPEMNPTLRTMYQKARDSSVPLDTIERAIKRGTGELEGVTYEQVTYEGYAPNGVAVLVEVLTDNRNRAGSEIRSLFTRGGGSLAEPGAVAWQFERKGIVIVPKSAEEDDVMTVGLDAGLEDLTDEGDTWRLTAAPTDVPGLRAALEEAGIPVVFHVGGTGDLIDPAYFQNGLPVPPDFHGGEENFRSVDYMGIPGPPAQTLATLIFDGVLERFPDLRIGVIEQGAIWVPSWLRQMESAYDAFHRHEERLQALSLRPSDYVRRQIRFTPYPTEDVGWIIANTGPEICLFSSDYPHVEGGRKPLERFESSLGDVDESVRQAFYCDNFLDLMGTAGRRLAAA